MKSDEKPVLIIACPNNIDSSDLFDASSSGLLLSSLLTIHKRLTCFALDWELSTINGHKLLLTTDLHTDESSNFFTNFLGKINSPRSLDDIKVEDYCGFIIPNVKAFMGSVKTTPLTNLMSNVVKDLLVGCKKGLISGYGILPTFECKVNGNWVFEGFNLTSLSLVRQASDERFVNFSYLVEDKVRELGANFVWNDKSEELLVLDRGIITVQDDQALSVACNLLGYILNESG
jgi:hypothetical protein